jgi:hypothetical protein
MDAMAIDPLIHDPDALGILPEIDRSVVSVRVVWIMAARVKSGDRRSNR